MNDLLFLMNCSKYDRIVTTPSLGDEARRTALQNLIKEGCLTSLYNHALVSSRIDWVRNYSLLALTKFATLNTDIEDVAITLQNDEIPLNFSLNKKKMKPKLQTILHMNQPTSINHVILAKEPRYGISGDCSIITC